MILDNRKIRRRYLYICLLFFLCTTPAFCQTTYQLKGKVVEEDTGNPVPFAQVAVLPLGGNQPLTGTTTLDNGKFVIALQPGRYDLAIVYVGYEQKKIKGVVIKKSDKNLGSIPLVQTTQQLEEIVVRGEAAQKAISTDVEGVTIRPDMTISNVGGSLLDVLRNSPSVNVSQDGSISLRGSGATNILIDGRNSALVTDLEQIPASAIKSIKIVNNPNAKYDAEGAGGVINIQLKRGEETGTNGKAEVTIANRYRLNSSLRLSHRTDKFNIYGGYSFRRWPNVSQSTTIRDTYTNNQHLEQDQRAQRSDMEHTLNYGAQYYAGKNKFSYEGALNFEKESDKEDNASQVVNVLTNEVILDYTRANTETEDNYTIDNAFIYERLFDDPKREFRAVVSHSHRNNEENQQINVFSQPGVPSSGEPNGRERSTTDELRSTTIVQADYVHPFINGKLETGVKSTFRSFDNDYVYEILDRNTANWVTQTDVTNRFVYKDQILAAYAIYSRTFNKFDLSVGSRLEQTFVDTRLFTTNEENTQSYLNWFPSLQMLYHPNEKNSLKLTYSRRIDRPGGWRLNPFPDISDSLNVSQGNPKLQPEFINSFELGHTINLGRVNLTSNLFYRHVDGQVDYIVRVEEAISYRQPANLNSSMTYGVELVNSTELFPWWTLNGSYSIFQIRVDGTNLNSNFRNRGISWNAKLTADFILPYEIALQLTGNYTAPEIEAQGRDLSRYYVDMSLKKSLFKEKANISLSLRDMFNTLRFAGENYSSDFRQTFNAKRETRILLLTMSYRF